MSMVKKCDICGKVYEPFDTSALIPFSGISFNRMAEEEFRILHIMNTRDCCIDCVKAIDDFVKTLEKNSL